MKQRFNCHQCDAFGIISIQNDASEFYEIAICPACGAELEHAKDTEEDDDE